jgi:hypothetical protein
MNTMGEASGVGPCTGPFVQLAWYISACVCECSQGHAYMSVCVYATLAMTNSAQTKHNASPLPCRHPGRNVLNLLPLQGLSDWRRWTSATSSRQSLSSRSRRRYSRGTHAANAVLRLGPAVKLRRKLLRLLQLRRWPRRHSSSCR